jgi:Cysteine rich repeat
MFSKYGLLIAVGIFVPLPALAEGGLMQGACMNDIKSLCGSIQPGGGQIRDCMKEHRTQLSIACEAAIANRRLECARSQSAGISAVIRSASKAGD